jgi:hypothetical protein
VFLAEYVVRLLAVSKGICESCDPQPKAGERNHGKKQLISSLTALGHQTFYQSRRKRDWKKAFDKSVDLVIAAGGDGTVRKTAWRLMDTGVPLAILPLGTANNLARSLGFTASPDEIVAHLGDGKARPFDVGIAQGACGKEFFLEAAGGGLLADFLEDAEQRDDKEGSRKQRMRRRSTACDFPRKREYLAGSVYAPFWCRRVGQVALKPGLIKKALAALNAAPDKVMPGWRPRSNQSSQEHRRSDGVAIGSLAVKQIDHD